METLSLNALTRFAHSRAAWLILMMSAVALELAALFFQYVMELSPCVMCIYQRVAVFGLVFAGLIGVIGHRSRIARFIGLATWAISAIWGLKLAIELVDMQTNPSPFATCSYLPEFPSWLQLHEWLPSVFMPTGMCSDIPWEFMGVTMGQYMIIAFATYLLALVIFLIPALKKSV